MRGVALLPLINSDDRVIRVEAGPGTGKTFGLGRRVERIVHPEGLGASPEKVLVVAFNRVIAADLKSEVSKRLEGLGLKSSPRIQTVHSLCLEMIGERHARMLLPHERDPMMEDILFRYPSIRSLYGGKREAQQALRNHEAGFAEHTTLWQAVQEWLAAHRARLVSDLPRETLALLAGGGGGEYGFEHVIADEFQDLSASEQLLVARLRDSAGSLVALGDPRQSIYLFRGNDRLGLSRLEDLVGEDVTDVVLRGCERCPPEIVLAANQLTSLDEPAALEPAREGAANTHLVYWKTPAAEAKGMAAAIADNVERDPVSRHLVMVTRRRFGFDLREQLRAIAPHLPVEMGFEESILELWPVREAFLFFCVLSDADPCTWRAWFAYRVDPTGSDFLADQRNAPAYRQLFDATGGQISPAAVLALATEEREARRGRGGATLWDRATRFAEQMAAGPWNDLSPEELIQACFDPSLWLADEFADRDMAVEDLERLRGACFEELAALSDPEDPGNWPRHRATVAERLRYRIAVRDSFRSESDAAVLVTTLWGGKGLTARHVYVMGLADEAIPGHAPADFPGTDEEHYKEQRRLFYVTITRSQQTLVMSWPNRARWGEIKSLKLRKPRRGSRYWADLRPTQFIRHIESKLSCTPIAGERWAGCASEG